MQWMCDVQTMLPERMMSRTSHYGTSEPEAVSLVGNDQQQCGGREIEPIRGKDDSIDRLPIGT
jgi:hypothetical protein